MNFTKENITSSPFVLNKNVTLMDLKKELQNQFSQAISLIIKTISGHFMEDGESEHFYFFHSLYDLAKQTKLLYQALYKNPLPVSILSCEKNIFILNQDHSPNYFYYKLCDKISQMITLTKLSDSLFVDVQASDKNNVISILKTFLECILEILEFSYIKFPEFYEN